MRRPTTEAPHGGGSSGLAPGYDRPMPSRLSLPGLVRSVLRSPQARRAMRDLTRHATDRLQGRSPERPDPSRGTGSAPSRTSEGSADEHGLRDRPSQPPIELSYSPVDDDRPDPGEIVWAWVPFEEADGRGKDRPVLVLAREAASTGGRDGAGEVLIALMLTSHDRGQATHTDRRGATWVDIGSGPWDRQGRPSEVRMDRLLRLPIDDVRREGARLDRRRFADMADAARRSHGWDR